MPGEEDARGREHRHQQADGSSRRPVPSGGARGDRDQPQGAGDPEGQVADEFWPDFAQVVGVLYELARGLYGSAEHPFPAFHVQSRALLESAIALPHQPYYETFYDKLAAMVRSIAANHTLEDGNKRLAMTVLHSTLLVNGYTYLWRDDDAVELMLRCASGQTEYAWLSTFIETWVGSHREIPSIPLEPAIIVAAMTGLRGGITQAASEHPFGQQLLGVISAHARGELDTDHIEWLSGVARARRSSQPTDLPSP